MKLRNSIVLFSASVAFLVSTAGIVLAPLHIYQVTSGWSGTTFWIPFEREPSENQIYWAVYSREPSLHLGNDRPEEIQALMHDFKPGYPLGTLRMEPYKTGISPDIEFNDGSTVKGTWLTEPKTRYKMPSMVSIGIGAFVYFLGAFLGAYIFALILRAAWLFFLERLSEISRALRKS